ncbi:hypothetical protein G5V59_15830 [Nocardioides sp. W3-2-3]|nr:hypothetical protein [Nocardioides convexus]
MRIATFAASSPSAPARARSSLVQTTARLAGVDQRGAVRRPDVGLASLAPRGPRGPERGAQVGLGGACVAGIARDDAEALVRVGQRQRVAGAREQAPPPGPGRSRDPRARGPAVPASAALATHEAMLYDGRRGGLR